MTCRLRRLERLVPRGWLVHDGPHPHLILIIKCDRALSCFCWRSKDADKPKGALSETANLELGHSADDRRTGETPCVFGCAINWAGCARARIDTSGLMSRVLGVPDCLVSVERVSQVLSCRERLLRQQSVRISEPQQPRARHHDAAGCHVMSSSRTR